MWARVRIIFAITFMVLFTFPLLSGCASNDVNDQLVVSSTDASSETTVSSDVQPTTEVVVQNAEIPNVSASQVYAPQSVPDPVIVAISETDPKNLAISVSEKSFLDINGTHVIEKTYVLPYTADIADLAAKRILVNGVEYSIDTITKAQNIIDKVHEVSKVADSEDAAKDFPQKLEYSGVDGEGVLERDDSSLDFGVNNTTTNTHGKSATKEYTMNIKDESQIPQSIVSGGVTLNLQSVSWRNNGDGGRVDAGGNYNTVPSSFTATAKYSGSYNTSSSDYKGTVRYVGRILASNSPIDTYVVTYKPSAPVVNASGNYASNLQNKLYPSVDQENRDWQEAQFRQGVEDNVSTIQTDIDELRAASLAMARTSQTMFMVMMIVLILLVLLLLGFVISKIKGVPLRGFRDRNTGNDETSGEL